jgi:hypothetical protein
LAVDPVSRSSGEWLEIVVPDEFRNVMTFVGVSAVATEKKVNLAKTFPTNSGAGKPAASSPLGPRYQISSVVTAPITSYAIRRSRYRMPEKSGRLQFRFERKECHPPKE